MIDFMKRRFSVNNLSSENNLPTYQLNAPVKEVRTNIAIYSHALLRIHITGGQMMVQIVPPSLPPYHSSPATRDHLSEVFLKGCNLNLQGLLHQQLLPLLWSSTVVSSLWVRWWFFHVCSGTAYYSITPMMCTISSTGYK